YRDLSLAAPADHAISGKRKFQNHFRALLRRSIQIARQIVGSLIGENAGYDLYPCFTQDGEALSADPLVRIGRRRHDTRHPCPHQRFGAGRRAPVMGAWLQRHISRRATRSVSRLRQRLWFRMGPAAQSEEHTSELQSRENLVCRLLLEKKK